MYLKIILSGAVIAVSTSIASAQSFVHCVQRALEAAAEIDPAFDPNGVDGAIGNGTRRAAAAFSEANQDLNLPNSITRDNVRDWCVALDLREELFGTPFTAVTHADTGQPMLFGKGAQQITIGEYSNLARVTGTWGSQSFSFTAVAREMTDRETAVAERLVADFAGEASVHRATIEPDFMSSLTTDVVDSYVLEANLQGAAGRKDLVFVGSDGTHRGVVLFSQNGEPNLNDVASFYVVTNLDTLQQQNAVDSVDWAALGLATPEPGATMVTGL